MRFKANIYRDHKKRGLSSNDEEKNCALLLEYIKQKENIIKEVRERIESIKDVAEDIENGCILNICNDILDKENK